MIDFSQATVLPGLIDAHTHMFNQRKPNGTTEDYMLIAVQNVQNDLRAGFTAARDMTSTATDTATSRSATPLTRAVSMAPAIRCRRSVSFGAISPRTLRLRSTRWRPSWFARPRKGAQPCAKRSHTVRIGSSCTRRVPIPSVPRAKIEYEVTYPLPVLQALIDETHRLGKKTGCHVYGGEGQKNAIIAGCDTIEHGFGLDQEQVNMMVEKGLVLRSHHRPLHRAVHGRQRQQEHRRQVPDDPDFRESRDHGGRHQGHQSHGGQRSRWLHLRPRVAGPRI